MASLIGFVSCLGLTIMLSGGVLALSGGLPWHNTKRPRSVRPVLSRSTGSTRHGGFDRCAATLKSGPGMLRIAWNKHRTYTISVPSAPAVAGAKVLTLQTGNLGTYTGRPDQDVVRIRLQRPWKRCQRGSDGGPVLVR